MAEGERIAAKPNMKTERQELVGSRCWDRFEEDTQKRPGVKKPDITRVVLTGRLPGDIKQEPDERLQLYWEGQWQEFLKTVQAPLSGVLDSQLPLLVSGEDAKKTQASFKRVAGSNQWPSGVCVTQTLPDLAGGIYKSEEKSIAPGEIKVEVVDEDAAGSEAWRQRFRQFCYQEAEGPRRVCSQLREFCHQWLRPERHTREEILELLILEQFQRTLPEEMRCWVREHGPETCAHAVALVEDFLVRQLDVKRWGPQEPFGGTVVNSSEADQKPTNLQNMPETKEEANWPSAGQVCETEENNLPQEVEMNAVSLERDKDFKEIKMEVPLRSGQASETEVKTETEETLQVTIPCWEENCDEEETMNQPRLHLCDRQITSTNPVRSFRPNPEILSNLRTHRGEKPHKCSFCGESFIQMGDLLVHTRIHTGEARYKCSFCRKNFNCGSIFGEHVRTHTGERPYKCSNCEKSFNKKGNLRTHMKIHTGEKPYKCLHCMKSYSRRARLLVHERIHTGLDPLEDTGAEWVRETKENNFPQELESNAVSLERDKDFQEIKVEVPLGSGKNSETELKTEPGETLQVTIPSWEENCDKEETTGHPRLPLPHDRQITGVNPVRSFRPNSEILNNPITHKGEKPHKCSFCGKSFTRKGDLLVHTRIHTGEARYKCSFCGKNFKRSSVFREHVRTHTGEKPYKCSNCGKSFSKKGNLRTHMKIHTGEKPYKCLHCMKSYSRRAKLLVHERIHARLDPVEDTGAGRETEENYFPPEVESNDVSLKTDEDFQEIKVEVPLVSGQDLEKELKMEPRETLQVTIPPWEENCDKEETKGHSRLPLLHDRQITNVNPVRSFRPNSEILNNPKTCRGEKPHKCSFCEKSFTWKWDMVVHTRIHTGEARYKCSFCGKNFRRGSIFREHVRTHTGERPYKCSNCGKSFSQKGNFRTHMKIHTGDKTYKCLHCMKSYSRRAKLLVHERIHARLHPVEDTGCQVK